MEWTSSLPEIPKREISLIASPWDFSAGTLLVAVCVLNSDVPVLSSSKTKNPTSRKRGGKWGIQLSDDGEKLAFSHVRGYGSRMYPRGPPLPVLKELVTAPDALMLTQ